MRDLMQIVTLPSVICKLPFIKLQLFAFSNLQFFLPFRFGSIHWKCYIDHAYLALCCIFEKFFARKFTRNPRIRNLTFDQTLTRLSV